MPRRSTLKAAGEPTLPAAIAALRQEIVDAVNEVGFVDPETGKKVKGDVVAALARIGHDPKAQAKDRLRALSILFDRLNAPLSVASPQSAVQVNTNVFIKPRDYSRFRQAQQDGAPIDYKQEQDS